MKQRPGGVAPAPGNRGDAETAKRGSECCAELLVMGNRVKTHSDPGSE